MDNIKVTAICVMYNHEKFARTTLDSLVAQKTSFKYEIIVHDDASTDKTPEIIMEYAAKYPDLIKPIIQKDNKLGKKINIYREYIYPQVKGEYIALLEGDDYWIDDNKLEKQADFMDNNPEYIACVHNSKVLENGIIREKDLCDCSNERDLSLRDVSSAGMAFYQTGSLFFRSSLIFDGPEKMPAFFDTVFPLFDYPFGIYITQKGKVRYFPECMSVYRAIAEGSWSEATMKDYEKRLAHVRLMMKMLDEADEWMEYKNHDDILNAQSTYKRDEYLLDWKLGNRDRIKAISDKEFIRQLGKKNGMLVALPVHHKLLYTLYKLYHYIKNKGHYDLIV